MPTLSDTAAAALAQAMATRGPRKGMLKASAPPSGTLAYAAWQGAMMVCNPYKASIAALMFMSPLQHLIAQQVQEYCDALPRAERIAMDLDRRTLEALGAW